MPGIIPMKVITVGNNSQARVAQACDRCRSKKIRCDGVRPCCSQCSSVGFECRTSDKLSRRAFPRGYTESLEERVRALESEVRQLKDLLDEKDDIIDILERLRSHSPPPKHPSHSTSPASASQAPHKASVSSVGTSASRGLESWKTPNTTSTETSHDDSASSSEIVAAFPKQANKQARPSRKRFRSPFSEYPHVESSSTVVSQEKIRRATAPLADSTDVDLAYQAGHLSFPSQSSISSEASMSTPLGSAHSATHSMSWPPSVSSIATNPSDADASLIHTQEGRLRPLAFPNLDYFPLGGETEDDHALPHNVSPEEWKQVLGSMECGVDEAADLYDGGVRGPGRILDYARYPGTESFPPFSPEESLARNDAYHEQFRQILSGDSWDGGFAL